MRRLFLSRALVSATIFGGILAGLAGPAFADWPTVRHDPARTAFAPGVAGIKEPTRYWQTYMGGTLAGNTHIALDIDGDKVVDVIYLAGGKAIAKHADDLVVWESSPLEFTAIQGAIDVDGDSALELIVSGGRNVFVLSGSTGKVLWKSPDGEVGNVGGVRIGDLDGDKHPEILIDDCACCGVTPIANPPGGVYHFDAGNIGAPTKIYAPLTRQHCGSQGVTLADFDADGAVDVGYLDAGTAILTSGKTGAALGTSDLIGETLYYTSCTAANVDDRPGDELICFQNSYLASNGTGGRRVFAVTYDTNAAPPARILYNIAPVPKDIGQLRAIGSSLMDLDGDGVLEITVSWYDGAAWATDIFDAKSGAVLASSPDQLAGIVDINGDKKPEVVTTTAGGLSAMSFQRGGAPPLTNEATFPSGYQMRAQHDFGQASIGSLVGRALEIDLVGDGKAVPVFFVDANEPQLDSYVAARVDAGSVKTLATYQVPAGISILTNQVYSNLNRSYPQLVLARNDGYLTFLDQAFAPTNGGTFGTPEFPEILPGMRVGGFIAAPIAPRLSGASDAVIGTDSRGALVNLNASAAWMSEPPKVAWERARSYSPTTAPTIDNGKPGIACTSGDTLAAVRADGSTLWTKQLGAGQAFIYDPLAGDVNGDGASDIFSSYTSTGSVLNLQVWSGKDGAPLWGAAYSEAMQWGFQPFSLADHNKDGVLDMFVVSNTLRVLSGATGATIASNPTFFAYFTPVIQDIDGDGIPEVTLSSGYYPARTFQNDLSSTFWVGEDDRPYQDGAKASCSGGRSVWVQPSTQVQGMLRLITMNGPNVGAATTLYLAGGAVFATAADAAAADKFLGSLGDVVVKQDLLGTGDHHSALIGSSDGFLYALNPCAGTLDWSYDLKFAVGNPIFADPNGAGADQILVPAADGYIHALQQRVLEAPAYVNDNAVAGTDVVVGADRDTVETAGSLGASWAAVADADGYQVAVLTEGGTFVSQPDWVSVGNVTSAAVPNLSVGVGKKYFFAVRAVSKTKGSSTDTKSNGVVVQTPSQPDGGIVDQDAGPDAGMEMDAGDPPPDAGAPTTPGDGSSGGCGCNAAGSDGLLAGVSAFFAAALAMARRRRRGL